MASVMEVPSGLHMPGLVDGKAPKGGLSEANDSPQTAHLPSPDIESSQSEAAPRSRITGTDPQSLAPLFQAFKDKLYYSGFVYKRRDLDQNGRRIVLKEGEQQWAPFWVELKGSVMQFRSADGVSLDDADMLLGKAPAIAELKERQEDPSCIDVSEACMVVVADPSGPGPSPTSTVTAHSDAHTLTPASAERPHSRAIDAPSVNFIYSFNMTTAGCNLYTIACPSVHMRDGWLFAIRLAQFEFARLCEAFTGRLLRKQGIAGTSWTDMGVDRNSLKPVLAHVGFLAAKSLTALPTYFLFKLTEARPCFARRMGPCSRYVRIGVAAVLVHHRRWRREQPKDLARHHVGTFTRTKIQRSQAAF